MQKLDHTLLQQMRITQSETAYRKQLLNFGPEDISLLSACREYIHREIDEIVAEFYQHLTEFDEIAAIIGDADTLCRLHATMKNYVLELFAGDYDLTYINHRLRVGILHKRIGVPPKLFLGAVNSLLQRLEDCIIRNISDEDTRTASCLALRKLLFFDTTLVFDTYIRSLLTEIESAKDDLAHYAQDLEHKVAERTRELEEQIRRDGLTGLYNQTALGEFLARDLAIARRNHLPLCLVYFDVDDFKEINDTHGHPHGDRVLQTIGGILRTTCRDSDVPCRYGGDEFCVLLPNSAEPEAEHLCERIVQELAQTAPEVKISIGIAQTGPEHHEECETLLKRADDLMYQRKRLRKRPRAFA